MQQRHNVHPSGHASHTNFLKLTQAVPDRPAFRQTRSGCGNRVPCQTEKSGLASSAGGRLCFLTAKQWGRHPACQSQASEMTRARNLRYGSLRTQIIKSDKAPVGNQAEVHLYDGLPVRRSPPEPTDGKSVVPGIRMGTKHQQDQGKRRTRRFRKWTTLRGSCA